MSENLTREITAARARLLKLNEYQIELDVREAKSDTPHFLVTSRITFEQLHEGEFHLDFIGESVQAVCVDEQEIDFSYDGARITFAPLNIGQHEITVEATGIYSHTGEGLHHFRDPLDGQTYLYTQFEPADARRVYPNFEQPDLKAKFAIAITAPEEWTVLSNGAQIQAQPAGDSRAGGRSKRVIFASTKPISTYLTAFIAGPYRKFSDVFQSAAGEIQLGYYCRETLAQYFDFDDINTVTKQGLATFPQAFGMAYQWGKYDSVFVPEYNLGAMENPGCVTFNEDTYIHRGHTTRAQAAGRANTIMHEMSHMWFGDLVTPKWWDDLWLKESFAEFMGAWALVESTKYQEAWQAFTGARLAWALANDQYPTTHPIIANVPDLEAADQVFDGITYAKGAAVLRQLVAWLGEENFFAGVRQYFQDHAFAAATFADLLNALANASGKDVHSWSKQWFETAGVSTVTLTRKESGVLLRQLGTDPLTGEKIRRPHLMQISAWNEGETGILERVAAVDLELVDELFIPWAQLGGTAPAAILPNDAALSYVKIEFDPLSLAAFLSHDVADPLSRAVIVNAMWQQVRDAKLPISDYLEYVQQNADLSDTAILAQLLNTAIRAIKDYAPLSRRLALASELLETGFAKIGVYSQSSDQGLLWRKAVAALTPLGPSYLPQLRELLANTTDQALRWQILTAVAALDALVEDELTTELQQANSAQDQVAYLEAISSIPGSQHETLTQLLDPEAKYSNLEIAALASGFMAATTAAQARAALPNFFEKIDAIWAQRSQEIAERIIYGIFPRTVVIEANPTAQLELQRSAYAWLAAGNHERALEKIVRDCLDESYRIARAQAFNLKVKK